MKTNKGPRGSITLAAILTVSALAFTGCNDHPESEDSATSNAPSAKAPDIEHNEGADSSGESAGESEESAPPPESLSIKDKSLQETAEKYISARENQASHFHKKPSDWLNEVKKYMTPEGYELLKSNTGSLDDASGGYAWTVSHDQGLEVKPRVGECVELTQASEALSETTKTVSCSVLDIVVDKKGKNVPTNEIPPTWPYVGEQQDALLEMTKKGEGWKVNADMTGMAN